MSSLINNYLIVVKETKPLIAMCLKETVQYICYMNVIFVVCMFV